ncbi:Clavaminate synthase-like protein [Auriculariales sp. MPI-PUGE-AT-0066]|nr:Clavaminate synthase-like protein [Auriculariales sp. MPI-PUGE-AT-0066]
MTTVDNTSLLVRIWPIIQAPEPCLCTDADPSACAQSHIAAVRDQAMALQRNINGASLTAAAALNVAITDAHNKIRSLDHRNVSVCWRVAYSDACIVRTASDLVRPSAELSEQAWLDAVRRLDMAIIIAGAPGEGRLDLIYDLIEGIQQLYLPITCNPFANDLPLSLSSKDLPPLPPHGQPIPRLAAPPSLHTFMNTVHTSPFILSGFLNDWPALNEHSWTNRAYLYKLAGRVVNTVLGDFLKSLTDDHGQIKARYLAQHNLFTQFPSLRDDINVPDYVYSDIPGARNTLALNVWLGPAGAGSPAHTDEFANCYCVVFGRRSIWLAPPSVSHFLQPTGNTATIKVFSSTENPSSYSKEFIQNVVPVALAATLEPGDMLYLPRGWWHAIRMEDPSSAVSMWF